MAVRSVVLAAALAVGPAARAADLLGPTGLIQVVPIAPVEGGGPAVDLFLIAVNPDGTPMTGLSLKATRTVGMESRWIEVGSGVYRMPFAPPVVSEPSVIAATARGKSASGVKVSASAPVQIMPKVALAVTPGNVLTLGRDTEVVLPVIGASASGVLGRASAGTFTALPGGTARYETPKLNYPHVAVLTYADAFDPLDRYGHASLLLNGSVEYPLKAAPGASVSLVIGDRTYGPVLAGADGKAKLPVEVPPGVQRATQVTTTNGQESREEIDLKIPETRRLELVPLPEVLPADPALAVPVRVVVRTPTGAVDPTAAPVFTPSAGSVGAVVNLGGGVYESAWKLPADQVEATMDVTLGSDLQKDSLTVALVKPRPAKIELAPAMTAIGPDTETIDVNAKLSDWAGAGLSGAELVIDVTGAARVGEVVDLGGGEYRFTLDPADTGATEVHVSTKSTPSRNPVHDVVVMPASGQVVNDGVATTGLVVAAVDAQGVPVGGATVMVDLTQGDGTISSAQLATGDDGTARTSYVAGKSPGLVGIRATSGGATGYGTVLQAPSGVALIPVPVAGSAETVALAKAWTASSGSLVIPRGGEPAAAGSPWSGAEPAVAAASVPVIRLTSDVTTTTPGGKITVTALYVAPPTAAAPAPAPVDAPVTDVVVPSVSGDPAVVPPVSGEGGVEPTVAAAPAPVVPELLVSGATMGAPTIGPDGAVTVTVTVAENATASVEITAKAAGVLQTLSIPLEGGNPWAGAPAATPVAAAAPAPAPKPESSGDRRWFRGRVAGLWSTYRYEQAPSTQPGPLLPSRLAVGGPDGGNAASPVGGEVDLRWWGDEVDVPYVGLHGQVRLASYGIQATAFNGIARDILANVEADLLGRYPFEAGGDQFWVGAKVGFHYSDFLLFTGCLDPGCTVDFQAIPIPGLGVGPELGADVGAFHLIAGYSAGFASATPPYSHGVDLNAGYEFVDRVFADLGFSVLTRTVELQGADSGIERGGITDSQMIVKLGMGFAL